MRMNIQSRANDSGKARVFLALWPNAEVRKQLRDLSRQYQRTWGGRVMREGTLHLTLLFLGNVERAQLDKLQAAMGAIRFVSFAFFLQQAAVWRHNRIGYVAPIDAVPELETLVVALKQAVQGVDIPFDQRGFAPHVTLLRNVERVAESRCISPVEWRVESFSLVESVLSSQGVRYRILQTWPSGG
jgi:2'-5' RNA ligase